VEGKIRPSDYGDIEKKIAKSHASKLNHHEVYGPPDRVDHLCVLGINRDPSGVCRFISQCVFGPLSLEAGWLVLDGEVGANRVLEMRSNKVGDFLVLGLFHRRLIVLWSLAEEPLLYEVDAPKLDVS
jgi:hypothetical protein